MKVDVKCSHDQAPNAAEMVGFSSILFGFGSSLWQPRFVTEAPKYRLTHIYIRLSHHHSGLDLLDIEE